MKKIEKLTQKQFNILESFRDKWFNIAIDTRENNYKKAEKLLECFYVSCGCEKPVIVWCDSPLIIEIIINIYKNDKNPYRKILENSLGNSLENSLRNSLGNSLENSLRNSLGNSLRNSLRNSLWNSLGNSLRNSLWNSLENSLRNSLWNSLWNSLKNSLWNSLGNSLKGDFTYTGTYFWGNLDIYWIAYYLFCQYIGVDYEPRSKKLLSVYAQLSHYVSWWYPFENQILVSRKPIKLHLNKEKRLHCDGGPAMQFRDGFSIWSLNNVLVSKEIAETPGKDLDPHLILEEKNADVRREIVRKIGIERICQELNAKKIDTYKVGNNPNLFYDTYDLLSLDLGDGRFRPYLKMLNASEHVYHIEGVLPSTKTAKEAFFNRYPNLTENDTFIGVS
jgi:hypothetical protein